MDIELSYTEKGSGVPLILLHGNGENSGYFINQLEEFSKRFRVIAIDTRGHGASPRGTAPFTISQFADDLYGFMELHKIQRAHILGFSDGGNTAIIFALRHPERLISLVLNGANLNPFGMTARVQIESYSAWIACAAKWLFNKSNVGLREMAALMAFQPHIKKSVLSEIKCPALVIAGTKDMIREKHTRAIASAIPGSRLVFIEGSHFIAKENSSEFNDAVHAFLLQQLKKR